MGCALRTVSLLCPLSGCPRNYWPKLQNCSFSILPDKLFPAPGAGGKVWPSLLFVRVCIRQQQILENLSFCSDAGAAVSFSLGGRSSSFCCDVRSLMYFPECGREEGGQGRSGGGPDVMRASKDCGAGSRQRESPGAFRQSILLRFWTRTHPPAAGQTMAAQPGDYEQE